MGTMERDEEGVHKTKIERSDRGTRPITAVLPTVTRDAFRQTAPGVLQLIEAWSGIVGPALAEATIPRRLAQGTLTIGCSGPMAMELQHLSTELIARINQYFGKQAVRRLRFVQILIVRAQRPITPRPDPAVVMAASQAVAHLPDGPLRDALASLGVSVLTKSSSSAR